MLAWPWARRVALVAAIVYFAVWIPATYSNFSVGVWAIGLTTFLLVASLVVLAGWTGQIPLSQAAFVGIGAFMVNNLVNRVGLPDWAGIPLAALSVQQLQDCQLRRHIEGGGWFVGNDQDRIAG